MSVCYFLNLWKELLTFLTSYELRNPRAFARQKMSVLLSRGDNTFNCVAITNYIAGRLNCWALFKDCVGVSCMYELFKLGVLFPCKSLLQIWSASNASIGREVFGETLSWWTPTRTTKNWPLIILGLQPLFLEMSVCRLLFHGISILICPNMLCAMSVDSACVRILWN